MNRYFVPLHVQYISMMKSNLFFQALTKFLLGLEGYSEYKQRVKYKVLPFIW